MYVFEVNSVYNDGDGRSTGDYKVEVIVDPIQMTLGYKGFKIRIDLTDNKN